MTWSSPRRVLFLCTGNYYRSRFCEELFNARAAARELNWQAFSRALSPSPSTLNLGPMSPYAMEFLHMRGIRPRNALRMPLEVIEFDFELSSFAIAMHEAEHRPMIDQRWPKYAAQIRYWHVADVETLVPHTALAKLEALVETLASRVEAGRSLTDAA